MAAIMGSACVLSILPVRIAQHQEDAVVLSQLASVSSLLLQRSELREHSRVEPSDFGHKRYHVATVATRGSVLAVTIAQKARLRKELL